MAIPSSVQERLRHQAGVLCGYCHTSVKITGQPLSIEHLVPLARGGSSDESNLWLSCRRCNEYKGAQVNALDPVTEQLSPLFNPRTQKWGNHFAWSAEGTHIVGRTRCGRATVIALNMNNPDMVTARSVWASVGWHPPSD